MYSFASKSACSIRTHTFAAEVFWLSAAPARTSASGRIVQTVYGSALISLRTRFENLRCHLTKSLLLVLKQAAAQGGVEASYEKAQETVCNSPQFVIPPPAKPK